MANYGVPVEFLRCKGIAVFKIALNLHMAVLIQTVSISIGAIVC